VYRVLVGKPKGRRPLGRPRRRGENTTKMDLSGCEMLEYRLDRAGSGYEKVAGTCECDNEHSGSINCREYLD
jgi:hypothetical protein